MPETNLKTARKQKRREVRKTPAASTARPKSRWWMYAAAAAVVLFVAFEVYAPALGGPFMFDDRMQPYHTPGFPHAVQAWIHGVRPLLMISYWTNYQFSQDPGAFHITNVLIHVLNAFLVFFVVRKLARQASPEDSSPILPAFAAAVFLLHPLQTESVSYIAGRSEALSLFFFLAAFAVFLYRRAAAASWQVAIAVLVLFGAAVATKEHTLALPALLLLTDYYWNPGFSWKGARANWRIYLPLAGIGLAGAAFVARVLALGKASAGFGLKDFTWYQYFFTECRAFFVYLRLFVFPAGQNLDWEFPISRSIVDHGAIFGLTAIILLIAAAIYYRRRFPLASYGVLVFVILLAPTSSFVPIKDPLAERRLYLPMLGLLLVLTALLQRLRVDRRKLAGALAVVVVVLAVVTYQRNQLWANETAMWEDAARKSPDSARAHFQLAHTYYSDGRCQEAVNEYTAAARLQKLDYGLLVDWGLAYECANQPDLAVAKLRQAAQLTPSAHVYSQIGMVYAKQSRWPEALAALAQAEKINPKFAITYYYRGGVRGKTGDFAGAVADYQHALALDPTLEPVRPALAYAQQQLQTHR